jgi:hypothetical protein
MSTLTKLKLVEAQKPTALPAIVVRRNKLSDKLWEQLQLARSQHGGEAFAPRRRKSVRNTETGERVIIDAPKRVRPWWFTGENGKVCFSVRYGSRVLDIARGKNAIEIANMEELVAVIEAVKSAVESGELDAQIEAASGSLKAGFKR